MRDKVPQEFFNFRGFKKVYMVTVLEGDGTSESPYREVRYIFDDDKDQYLGVITN